MSSSDTFTSVFIITVFIALSASNALAVGVKNIKKNWMLYRCNPGIIPFASFFGHDVQDNFMYCIQNTQSGYMKYLMVPFHYILSLVGSVATQLVKNIQDVREFINRMRARVIKLIQNLFGVILNIIITFQKIIISMRDLMNKLVGIFTTILYLMTGALYTVKSMWSGVAGVLVRSLGTS
jgi:hypothetical protein